MSSTAAPVSNVLYQKIVRPSDDVPPVLFLGHLVEYLQDRFELPANLPMVYEATKMDGDDSSNHAILSWDSPLSSFPEGTRLNVEVVGIYTDEDENDDSSSSSLHSSPKMAMVVVSKASTASNNPVAPMMKNLFQESEKRILQALDKGLDDFSTGKIKISTDVTMNAPPANFRNVHDAIQAEVMEDVPKQEERVLPEDVIVDTTSSEVESASGASTPTASDSEYAVQAAKRAASLRNTSSENKKPLKTTRAEEGDFAVQAAKRIASQRQANGQSKTTKGDNARTRSKSTILTPKSNKATPAKRSVGNSFRATISTPEQRSKRKKTVSAKKTKKRQRQDTPPVRSKASESKPPSEVSAKVKADVRKSSPFANGKSDKQNRSTPPKLKSKRKLNIRVVEENTIENGEWERRPFEQIIQDDPSDMQASPKKETTSNSKPKKTVTNEQMERDVAEAAQKVMSELASQAEDITAEELLEDVLKFGEEKDKEGSVGNGFVSGAFEKAKELLRERKQVRDERISKNTQFREVNDSTITMQPDIVNPHEQESTNTRELTAEEELKRIFQAGERLAEGRITTSNTGTQDAIAMGESEGTTEQDIDELIASEKTISPHARILDDELAELEVRINKSPDEELDGPRKNPVFDIFTGPEVYNPNVDPETAVNWPGAQSGTKEIRLPKELDEAVKQAKFATDVLTKLREVQKEGSEGGQETQYFVGDKQLTQKQVDDLRLCVVEAAQVGLIENPLVMLAERSRLQMVLDEITGQPGERIQDIISNYKDLLLSDNFVSLVQERLSNMADRDLDAMTRGDDSLEGPHALERELLGHLVVYAQLLLKEARALGAELEASQLEIVRSICEVAMDPSHTTEEETSMALTDAVRDMRPMLDDSFVAYLKYAVAEEEGRLARAGLLDDPAHNEWLFVLQIVQQGVYAEIANGINRYIEHIWYVLRMETREDRRDLLKEFIDVMPTMDVRPFVHVVDNIVGSLGDSVRGDFDAMVLGEMSNKLLQLYHDVHDLLPPERIDLMSRDADEWAAEQRKRLMERRKITQQRLTAARETQEYDEEIRRRGEVERMT